LKPATVNAKWLKGAVTASTGFLIVLATISGCAPQQAAAPPATSVPTPPVASTAVSAPIPAAEAQGQATYEADQQASTLYAQKHSIKPQSGSAQPGPAPQ
jgi:hypothetical protein